MGAGPPRILDELPNDGRPWRLDFIGGVTRVACRRTPMIALHFTPYVGQTRSRASLESPESYDWSQNRIIHAAVSDMSFFRIGSLWTGGSPEAYPDYETHVLDLEVSRSTCHLASAYERNAQGYPLIPKSQYRIRGEIADGHIAFFPSKGAFAGVIIPCSEIFRFYYYGVSGKFGAAILDGTYFTERDKIAVESRSSWPDAVGKAHLQLGKYVDDSDRFEIARTTFSEVAREESQNVLLRMRKTDVGFRYPLVIKPPFEGPTHLGVRGIRLKAGAKTHFLVLAIETCSAQMPFQHLEYSRENDSSRDRPISESAKVRETISRRDLAQDDIETAPQYTQQTDPSAKDLSRHFSGVLNRNRYTAEFTDSRAKGAPIKTISRTVYNQRVLDSIYASGTSATGSNVRAAAFAAAQERGLAPDLADFKNTINLLPTVHAGITVVSLGERAFPIPGGRRRTWPFFDGHFRKFPRRAVVAVVSACGRSYVIIEIERRPTPTGELPEYFQTGIFAGPLYSVSSDDVRSILRWLVSTRGTLTNTIAESLPGWSATGLRHYGHANLIRSQELGAKLSTAAS